MTQHKNLQEWFNALLNDAEALDDEARLALWKQAALDRPDFAPPYLMLGAEYAQRGENAAAEDAYSCALLAAPGLSIARFQLGLLQMCNDRTAAAVLTFQPLTELDAQDPLRLFAEGLIALAAERPEEAILKLQQGMIANKHNPALNHDMQLVIDRLNAAAGDHTPADYHFLLANYREAGKLH